jgi:hypothetical protein
MSKETLVILGGPEYPYFGDCFNSKSTRASAKCPMPGIFVEVSLNINQLKARDFKMASK